MPPSQDLLRLQELARERDAARAAVDAHLQQCIASAPHGYAVCQTRYERLTERLEDLERRLRSLAGEGG